MHLRCLPGVALAALTLVAGAAQAAGIDCSKARSPTEKAICASPNLLALDQQIAGAYADALQRQPASKDAMRQDLVRWLKQRDTACALPSADIPACLAGQMTARLTALAPPAAVAVAPPSGPLQTAAASARPADPEIPPGTIPPGAATLDQASLPASEHGETLLHVASPGRFTIAAKSPSGAALQLVDIMTGPSETAGTPGIQDGRLDPLLDAGTYKLRVTSGKAATGSVALSVTPFHDAAPPAALPPTGFPLTTMLHDGEQRAYWLAVPDDGAVRIEAAGRALADLRLWRDGRTLTALDPAALRVEPISGHPLTDLRLTGKLEPGTYLAVAYGGPALPWTDNDPAQPLLLRSGASPALAEGWASGPMGPFGSEIYALPPATGLLRLTLPATATAELRAGAAIAAIAPSSREPAARLPIDPKQTQIAEVRAAAGQAFTLQALAQPPVRVIDRPGTYWVSAVVNGAGGDEVPPTMLLERSEGPDKPNRILASTVPRIGPGAAWHTRFNLRGPTTLLVQNTAGGELAVRTAGVPTGEHGRPGIANLPADYYGLDLTPDDGAIGSLDLVVGPPGAAAPPLATLTPDPVLSFGVQTIAAGQSLRLSGPSAPGLQFGLSARPIPVALAQGPLTVTQAAGTTIAVPIALAPSGTLAVSEVGAGPVAFGLQDTGAAGGTVVVPIADHARTIVLAWRRTVTVSAIPAPPPPGAASAITAGTPIFFDLARDEHRGFAVTAPQGGLYRVETLGRLHTAGRIGSAFIPLLAEAEANGAGQNMLLQPILRAGRYQVDVTALQSAGHLGLSVTPAATLTGATLTPGGSVRASVPAGTAIGFPLQIAGPGETYHLQVASLGAPWQGRIEDAEGWPLTRTGPLDDTAPTLPPGSYRLAVAPDTVARQIVSRLTAVTPAQDITGHGPHALPFETPQSAVWREPDARDAPRTPDSWIFTLAGPADITLQLGDGMTGELRREGDATALARVVGHYAGLLQAGRYRLDATSLGRNDRLAYTIALASKALQPGVPRTVTLPGTVEFAIAAARVVSLTSYGNTPLKAVLRHADGSVISRAGARADDWNIAASRLLPAGRYTLDLAAASPPDLSGVDQPSPAATEGDGGDKPGDDDQDAQTPLAPVAYQAPDAPADAPDAPTTELSLALPDALPVQPAPATAAALTGPGVHELSLDRPAPGGLVIAQAASSASLVLALERKTADLWHVTALAEGTAPFVASPADADPAPWRVEVWTVDGGAEPIRIAARAIDAAAQDAGTVSLAALDNMPGSLAVGHIHLDAPAPVSVSGPAGLLAGGWGGQALTALNGPVLPQGHDLWLVGLAPGNAMVTPLPLDGAQALIVPPGQTAQLPAAPAAPGHVAIWRAEGGFGQPGLGAAAGIARFSSVAHADAPVTLRNASGDGPLRVTLTRQELTLLPGRSLDAPLQTALPPGAALPLTLPAGDKALQLDLGAAVAAFADGSATWAGGAPLSRTLIGGWTELLLVNTGATAAPVSLSWQPAPLAVLRPGGVTKRFFGAAGSFEIPFEAPAGAHLIVAGPASITTIANDGAVGRGGDVPVAGAGRAIVDHKIGPVAVWIAADGTSPWPAAAAQAMALPAHVALTGEAMAFTLNQPAASLLHVATTAPVLAALTQAGRTDPPRLFPAGAELHMTLAAGPAELRLYSPTDGQLTGSLALSAAPVTPVTEGLGEAVSVAPGGSAAFGFTLAKPATIGVGIRADPDRAAVRLLDATGAVMGEGVAQLRTLPAGAYVIEAQIPPDAPPTILRPAVIGMTPRGAGPPPDVVQHYLELVGLKPQEKTP